MTKRANGEGCLRRRVRVRRDGSSSTRYSAVITTECTSTGKQKRLEGTSRETREEALTDLEKLRVVKSRGFPNAYITTLRDYLDYWLSQVRPRETCVVSRKQLAPKTYQGYKRDVEHFIKPALGNLKLNKLEPITMQRWQDGLEREHGLFVAKNASATLSSALTRAVRWRLLERSPYEKGAVSKIVVPQVEADYWEPSEAKQFITAKETRQHPYFVAYYLTLNLGFRMSELRGLMWQDIEYLENKSTGKPEPHIHVQRQAVNDRQVPAFSERLKTKASGRYIPLPSSALELLRQHQREQRHREYNLGTIVTNAAGGVPTMGHRRQEFYKLSEMAKVRRIKFHGLRRTAGSLWIEAGVSLLRASRWLGHSHMRTTEKIYIHLLREASHGESISLERMLKIGA